MHVKLLLGVNFNVCVCCASDVVDIEAETPHGTWIYTWTRAAFVDTMCQKISVLQ